jgi:hypothetical protein
MQDDGGGCIVFLGNGLGVCFHYCSMMMMMKPADRRTKTSSPFPVFLGLPNVPPATRLGRLASSFTGVVYESASVITYQSIDCCPGGFFQYHIDDEDNGYVNGELIGDAIRCRQWVPR